MEAEERTVIAIVLICGIAFLSNIMEVFSFEQTVLLVAMLTVVLWLLLSKSKKRKSL